MTPIRMALFGSGVFAHDAHLPALKRLTDQFDVVAVYSRSEVKAKALAAAAPHPADVYTDMAPVLERDDVDAVDIILPIAVQPAVVEAALKAGKHVISEKPVAPDVASGRALLATAAQLTQASGRIWMLAENFRFEPAFQQAAQIIRGGDLGRPIQFYWNTYVALRPQDKYYQTPWRRDNSFPGGFILDGGVHDIAAMRTMMGEVESVCAYVTQVRADLPPCDTLSATLRFDSGAFGIYTKTFVGAGPWDSFAHVVGDQGALRVNNGRLEVTRGGQTTSQAFALDNVEAELADFARCIQRGRVDVSTPEQGLQDVAILEAMFDSAREGRAVEPARVVAAQQARKT
jgi:predicted dehydrogenase